MTQNACEIGKLVEQYLDPACNALANEGDILDRNDPVVNLVPIELDNIIEYGRLRCDPYCRSKEDQVIQQVQALFEENPFVLVEEP